MKVLQVNCNGYYGSTGKIVRKLSAYLTEMGEEDFIACSGYREKSTDEKTYCVSGNLTVKLNQTASYLCGDAGFHFGLTTKKLIRLIREQKPDIVHLHHLESYFINVVELAEFLQREKIPTVWTMHDCWPFTGHCTHFFSVGCDKWKTGCHDCPQKKDFPYSLFLDRSRSLFEKKKKAFSNWENLHIVNVSRWMQGMVKRSFLGNKDMRVIYNGIDPKSFYPSETAGQCKQKLGLEGKFVILSVASSWSEKKGWSEFLKLAEKLGEDEKIVLVGVNEKQAEELPSGILGIPKVRSIDALRDYYSMADVYLNLSLEETFGLVSVEAMACGTPVIACNTTANPEIAAPECGVILQERKTDQILDALRNVRANGKAFYAEVCRNRVKSHFSEAAMCEGYYKLYSEILGKRGKS